EFWWQTAPVEILATADGTRAAALRCVRTAPVETDSAGGRRSFQTVAGSEFEIPVDMVIKALGQQKMTDWLSQIAKIKLDAAGRVAVDPDTMQTANPKFFAGGDCVNGGREAVDAAQAGTLAAQGIHEHLTGERVEFAGARVPFVEKLDHEAPAVTPARHDSPATPAENLGVKSYGRPES
ncbi:MAG TPA: FAD-dependent oxidoreductase, partial [Pyrinomonadaceae bacterium]|nr:FAD-dependent oxidoreductase [Pyrinomonadaceae bacterium]